MFRKFFLIIVISLWGVVVLPLPKQADAATPLTLAVIQNLRNLVQLMPQNKPRRQAYKSDAMSPGDGLSTGRSALADLRFNDGSLVRIGEQAVFRFLPKTRNLKLSNGTVLLLIPPGKGQTRIKTPNAAAAIRGSGLFVRYDHQTDTTIVGALTNSGIEVFNKDASQKRELQAGQLIVIVKGKFRGLYDFDLRTFYETSALVRELDLPLKHGIPNSDPAIASVQAETAAAVAAQSPVAGQDVVENPSFVEPTTTFPSANSPTNNIIRDNSPVDTLLDTGQVVPVPSPKPTPIPTPSMTPPTNQQNNTPPTVTPSEPSLSPAPIPPEPAPSPAPTLPVTPPTTTPNPANPSAPPTTTPNPANPSAPPTTTPNPANPSAPPTTTPNPANPSAPPTTTPNPANPSAPPTTPNPANPSAPPTTPPTNSQPTQETPVRPST
ncbi:MAG: FecR family protein [Iphinoe sp. HA4291-MV1]|nr:FecR family protein [Iphinoe sp. HA4291-MV1]